MRKPKYAWSFTDEEKRRGEEMVMTMSVDAQYVYKKNGLHMAYVNDSECYIDFGITEWQFVGDIDTAECAIIADGSCGMCAYEFQFDGESFGSNCPKNWKEVVDELNEKLYKLPCFDEDGWVRPQWSEDDVWNLQDEIWEEYCRKSLEEM